MTEASLSITPQEQEAASEQAASLQRQFRHASLFCVAIAFLSWAAGLWLFKFQSSFEGFLFSCSVLGLAAFAHFLLQRGLRRRLKDLAIQTAAAPYGRFTSEHFRHGDLLRCVQYFQMALPQLSNATTFSHDCIYGYYKTLGLRVYEGFVHEHRGNDVVTYSRLYVHVTLPERVFYGQTLIGTRAALDPQRYPRLRDIPFADKKFLKRFRVLSNDGTEAHYLMEPAALERLAQFQYGHKTRAIQIAFKENQSLIMVETDHDHFEIGDVPARLVWDHLLQAAQRDFAFIMALVDAYADFLVPHKGKLKGSRVQR